MNLTVAMKIIGGFAIISILLIITSVISLLNLNTISDSTVQQNQLAIPTLKGSNNLSLELSQMTNSVLKGFYQVDLNALNDDLTHYKETEKLFIPAFNSLKTLVANEQELINNLNKVTNTFAAFDKGALTVFNKRKIAIEQKSNLIDKT